MRSHPPSTLRLTHASPLVNPWPTPVNLSQPSVQPQSTPVDPCQPRPTRGRPKPIQADHHIRPRPTRGQLVANPQPTIFDKAKVKVAQSNYFSTRPRSGQPSLTIFDKAKDKATKSHYFSTCVKTRCLFFASKKQGRSLIFIRPSRQPAANPHDNS